MKRKDLYSNLSGINNLKQEKLPKFLDLPQREKKPRQKGITHIIDSGLGLFMMNDMLQLSGDYIDIVKLGWGTSYISPKLQKKIDDYHNNDIKVSLGGTLLEGVVRQNKLDRFISWAEDIGVDYIEVSDGVFSITPEEKYKLIKELAKKFHILSEVGSKDTNVVMAPYKWVAAIKNELDAGAWKVILEGRETGTAGLYRESGEIRHGLVDEIMQTINPEHLIFEAPQKSQQVWFIKEFGSDVNLGNIAYNQVIPLETLRLGLRGDTMLTFFK